MCWLVDDLDMVFWQRSVCHADWILIRKMKTPCDFQLILTLVVADSGRMCGFAIFYRICKLHHQSNIKALIALTNSFRQTHKSVFTQIFDQEMVAITPDNVTTMVTENVAELCIQSAINCIGDSDVMWITTPNSHFQNAASHSRCRNYHFLPRPAGVASTPLYHIGNIRHLFFFCSWSAQRVATERSSERPQLMSNITYKFEKDHTQHGPVLKSTKSGARSVEIWRSIIFSVYVARRGRRWPIDGQLGPGNMVDRRHKLFDISSMMDATSYR